MSALRAILFVTAILAMQSAARAHQLDEYIQATLVEIEPDEIRLSIHMTPGVEVADKVFATIDRNKNGEISPDEVDEYGEAVGRDIKTYSNRIESQFRMAKCECPGPAELRSGTGIIKIEFVLPMRMAYGHHLFRLENRHMPEIGAYLFNAAMPKSKLVRIEWQMRNTDQSQGDIDFFYLGSEPKGAETSAKIGLIVLLVVMGVTVIAAVSRGRPRG